MAVTAAEAKAWDVRFVEGIMNTTAPYYGVNTFDVRQENWDAMVANAKGQMEGVEACGGSLYLWAATDLGPIKRVVWINYYPKALLEAGPALAPELQEKMGKLTAEAMESLYDNYNWYFAKELPEGPTTIG